MDSKDVSPHCTSTPGKALDRHVHEEAQFSLLTISPDSRDAHRLKAIELLLSIFAVLPRLQQASPDKAIHAYT